MLLTPVTILLAAAVIPAFVLLYQIYHVDSLEKEPGWILRRLILKGVLATLFAGTTEWIGTGVLAASLPADSYLYKMIYMYVVIALSEEGFKYLLLWMSTWNSPHFNCSFDGIIYAVFVSMGFALWENILYVFRYGMGVAFLRAVTAIPGHACFGVFMGMWYGLARKQLLWGEKNRSAVSSILSLAVPVFFHGTYDLLANIGKPLLFLLFIVIMFVISFKCVKRQSELDHYL